MLSRRQAALGVGAGFLFLRFGLKRKIFGHASQPSTPVDFGVPPGACDCHAHVFGDPSRFPFAPGRAYTPQPASGDELRQMHRALHVDRTVVVQPSVYGTDNSCTLDAIRQLGPSARGVAVLGPDTSDAELDAWNARGIRGARINLATAGQTDPIVARRRLAEASRRVAPLGWHIEMYTGLPVIQALADQILSSPVPVVFDHFAGAQAALGTTQPGFATLLRLVRSGRAYVTLSGAYRCSDRAPDYPDVAPLARALVEANPARMLWASDWPHPDSTPGPGKTAEDVTPLYREDDGHLFNLFARWVPDHGLRRAILVDNPAELYKF